MRLHLPKPLLLPTLALSLALLSCDRDITSTEDQPQVDYVLIVSDSLTSAPLESVKIRVTAINGDTSTYYTDRQEGRAELATLSSSRTLFVLSKTGYKTLDILDTVNAKPDTIFNRPVQRLLRAKLVNLNPDLGRIQVNILLRDEGLKKILGGVVTLTDSLGGEKPFGDNDSDGTIGLSGLKVGKNLIKVEHHEKLGRMAEVTLEKGADTGLSAQAITIRLAALDNSISGQVYYKTAGAPEPLKDAKVEFHLKDSLAVPSVFRTFTAADEGGNGRFLFPKVPAREGELWFFKNRTSTERTKVIALTQEEVLMDGSIPLVTLTIASDPLLPFLVSGPRKHLPGNDTVAAKDVLEFKFNQAVGEIQFLKVRLINESELLINSRLGDTNTLLKVWQKGADWIQGKKYEYELALTNNKGERFSIPGDSALVVRGIFTVRVDSAASDSNLIHPREIRFAYFNSGNHYQFGPADTNTSPKADSSSEFARLKWGWETGKDKARKVDSLLIYFKDGKSAVNWTLWGALPGFLDSANLTFSDHYSTLQVPSQKSRFPIRDSAGQIFFRIIPKHGGRTLDDKGTDLEGVTQGMGPTVYVSYSTKVVPDTGNSRDSVDVLFLTRPSVLSSFMAWGASSIRPTPKIYLNDKVVDTTTLLWRWVDNEGTTGRLVYKLPNFVGDPQYLRVDLNGQSYLGKPIWMRNPHDKKVLGK